MSRYSDLIEANVSLDFSNLEARLDELTSVSEEDVEQFIQNALDQSDFESRISSLESLNTCGVDVNTLGDLPDRVSELEARETEDSLRARVEALEQRLGVYANKADNAALSLGEWRAEDFDGLAQRIEALERNASTSQNAFALIGKLIALFLGARS